MELTQLFGFAGIPVIAGIIQMLKNSFPGISDRYWPLIAWVLAVGFNILLGWRLNTDLWVAGIFGIVVGLAASGFYSQGKTYVASKTDVV